ncbi:MAG: Unknown protein [uncultured Sulfurovum sp.]|uniref:Uncharacterized protein n=1 Tax=uncultured Sulfurovum sp. TaxID=269237 RepID=A0A6S6TK43_9BACT|nr:MAG: Unknown protein [uncultured Sulfurovum sp.]
MIEPNEVFDSIRRGYTDLNTSSNEEIFDYFQTIEEESMQGHISNIKGILFEHEYVQSLEEMGTHASIFEATNHPVTDISIFDDNGDVINELQLKATDSIGYINETLVENPDVTMVVTSEVATNMSTDVVIDSGIENAVLENSVLEVLSPIPVTTTGFAFAGIGLLFGLPF